MEAALKSSAAAIQELCESLEEEALGPISVQGRTASFSVQAEDGGTHAFAATFQGDALPCPVVLACTSGSPPPGLARANKRLAQGCRSLACAVAAAGRTVGADLDWTTEAEGDGAPAAGGSCWRTLSCRGRLGCVLLPAQGLLPGCSPLSAARLHPLAPRPPPTCRRRQR